MSTKPIFDLIALKAELVSAEWQETEDGDETRQVYLGTIFSLMPSGKYYTPFACSNVTDDEAAQDEAWRNQAEAELDLIGACLVSGEGDPCDLFAAEYRVKGSDDE